MKLIGISYFLFGLVSSMSLSSIIYAFAIDNARPSIPVIGHIIYILVTLEIYVVGPFHHIAGRQMSMQVFLDFVLPLGFLVAGIGVFQLRDWAEKLLLFCILVSFGIWVRNFRSGEVVSLACSIPVLVCYTATIVVLVMQQLGIRS